MYATMDEWLDEIENFGLRRERMPVEALPWVEAAWRLATEAERERCCSIVYGQCSSDNVAERTVRAIRNNPNK